MSSPRKLDWQRQNRSSFKSENGYSTRTHYRFEGNRKLALERDGFKCVHCGMTDEQHREKWGRPITVDHIDVNEKNNALENLQTLCLSCHGIKDNADQKSKLRDFKEQVMQLRAEGKSCNQIAKQFKVGCKIVTKWIKRWNGGVL